MPAHPGEENQPGAHGPRGWCTSLVLAGSCAHQRSWHQGSVCYCNVNNHIRRARLQLISSVHVPTGCRKHFPHALSWKPLYKEGTISVPMVQIRKQVQRGLGACPGSYR